jgi:sugar lactone lactonase YvrE
MMMRGMGNMNFLALAATALLAMAGCGTEQPGQAPPEVAETLANGPLARAKGAPDRTIGQLELVAEFNKPMQTGVTVSRGGRIFINIPRWADPAPFTVGELKDGKLVAFPDEQVNKYDESDYANTFVSVQSVVVDPDDRLWVLDTGSINLGPVRPMAPKLVGIDLHTNRIFQKIQFPDEVVLPTTYLNDIRFDMRRSREGMAFITDSSGNGPGAIIVVDLHTGKSWRRLNGHRSVTADPDFKPVVEGEPLMMREPGQPPKPLQMSADGIAISGDGQTLYYRPLASHHLYSVSVDALAQSERGEQELESTVKDLGDIGYASDGMESDDQGNLYLTDYEHAAVHVRNSAGEDRILLQDPRLIWPDTLSVSHDGYLYVSVNQLDRGAQFHDGKDLRKPPFALFRAKIGRPGEAATSNQVRCSDGNPSQQANVEPKRRQVGETVPNFEAFLVKE